MLTLRSAGDLVFYNSLSDGFASTSVSSLWLAPLMAQNPLLPVNTQSWAYRLTAGADFGGVASSAIAPVDALGEGRGSLLLGKNLGNANFVNGSRAATAAAISNGNRLQVIRTGSGSIAIAAGRDVRLMNTFASIYTAGTQVLTPGSLYAEGDFTLPVLDGNLNNVNTVLGSAQQAYPVQYAMQGGNISINAGVDIARYTLDTNGELIDDASRQIPGNWLYRRSYVDPITGEYGATGATQSSASIEDPSASTTWWIDYSNFFQSVGTLGGGNVAIAAGNDVRNVDAVAPTNARAPSGVPDASRIVELGGGNVSVSAGADILGGTYYVENGVGTLNAGGSITLESTTVGNVSQYNPRSPSLGILSSLNTPEVTDPSSWIPTTLFLGRGGFDLAARGDVLLGSVSNTFLAPAGIGNKYWYKTWFSTYDEDSYLNVRSLSGDVTHRLGVNLPDFTAPFPTLQAWLLTQNQFSTQLPTNGIASDRQPWLRLSDASATQYGAAVSLMPGTLRSTALAGDIRIVGDMTLSPSPSGTLEIAAAGSVLGLNQVGTSRIVVSGQDTNIWQAATINLSDANPDAIPGVTTPLSYVPFAEQNSRTGLQAATATARGEALVFTTFDTLFSESGSYQGRFGVTQIKQALHDSGVLHRSDPNPLQLYALGGDISGITLFSPKASRVVAGQDLTDVALYLQNVNPSDFSIVTAGRDILPYNPNSPLRSQATAAGNLLAAGEAPLVGDVQIGGPGSLEILAGRRLTLGAAPAQADGTGDGISSIGNLRNPFLSSDGANLILAAGIGAATSLSESDLDLEAFITQYVQGGEGQSYLDELGITDFEGQSPEEQARIALEVFYKVLRDAGRNFATAGNYDAGTAAIDVLFGGISGNGGDIDLSSRGLKTRNGGSISVVAPGGGVSLGSNLGSSLVPPGIITESGGDISVYSRDSVDVGVLRIFTLRGGNIVIYSSEGDVAAGSSAKTVAAAPPTRVIIDPQSADVATDLAGLATGGGIGVLATVKNVEPGDVDLIAPLGAVDAGDAGIRSAGNLTIAAAQVLNAGNIAVGGISTGAPSVAAAAPAVSAAAPPPPPQQQPKTTSETNQEAARAAEEQATTATLPESQITVKVLGYGGSSDDEDEDDEEKKKKEAEASDEEDSSEN
ncbi:MAG: filamentous hemagglutinin family protein [Verrucomicrobiales bacterium]